MRGRFRRKASLLARALGETEGEETKENRKTSRLESSQEEQERCPSADDEETRGRLKGKRVSGCRGLIS